MRISRLKKYKQNRSKLLNVSQVALIYLLILSSLHYLTSGTFAYFSNSSKSDITITSAADWWDKSKLIFPNNGTQVIHSCPPTEISVEIINIGLSMSKATEYEIYYSNLNGNPQGHGEKIGNGLINPIEANGVASLIFSAGEEGWYVLKALQRLGFENDYESRKEIWSEKIKVQCKQNSQYDKSTEEETPKEKVVEEKKIDNKEENETTEDSSQEGTSDEQPPVEGEESQEETEESTETLDNQKNNDSGNTNGGE